MSQSAELLAVQEQPGAADTEMVPELPAAGLSIAAAEMVYVQGLIKIATPLPPLPPARVAPGVDTGPRRRRRHPLRRTRLTHR